MRQDSTRKPTEVRRFSVKIGDTLKTLPWTDKVCHFVRFETTYALS
jgi:hypothetical protein